MVFRRVSEEGEGRGTNIQCVESGTSIILLSALYKPTDVSSIRIGCGLISVDICSTVLSSSIYCFSLAEASA